MNVVHVYNPYHPQHIPVPMLQRTDTDPRYNPSDNVDDIRNPSKVLSVYAGKAHSRVSPEELRARDLNMNTSHRAADLYVTLERIIELNLTAANPIPFLIPPRSSNNEFGGVKFVSMPTNTPSSGHVTTMNSAARAQHLPGAFFIEPEAVPGEVDVDDVKSGAPLTLDSIFGTESYSKVSPEELRACDMELWPAAARPRREPNPQVDSGKSANPQVDPQHTQTFHKNAAEMCAVEERKVLDGLLDAIWIFGELPPELKMAVCRMATRSKSNPSNRMIGAAVERLATTMLPEDIRRYNLRALACVCARVLSEGGESCDVANKYVVLNVCACTLRKRFLGASEWKTRLLDRDAREWLYTTVTEHVSRYGSVDMSELVESESALVGFALPDATPTATGSAMYAYKDVLPCVSGHSSDIVGLPSTQKGWMVRAPSYRIPECVVDADIQAVCANGWTLGTALALLGVLARLGAVTLAEKSVMKNALLFGCPVACGVMYALYHTRDVCDFVHSLTLYVHSQLHKNLGGCVTVPLNAVREVGGEWG